MKVKKSFYTHGQEQTVINNISLKVKRGEVFGFLGLNGAGKTTTVKMIVDLLHLDSGRITIDGNDHRLETAKQKVGFMPEQPQFYQHLTAQEVLQFAGSLFQIEPTVVAKRTASLLEQVGLASSATMIARQFSKGMHQRLGFAVALINDPSLLILDEPLDGLDPVGRQDLKKLLQSLRKAGKTIFLSSHILSDVEEICDQVAIIEKGKIIEQGKPSVLAGKGKTLEERFVSIVRANGK